MERRIKYSGALLLCSLFLLLCLLPRTAYAAEASGQRYDLVIEDQAGLLSRPEDREAVAAVMEKIAEESHVIFYSTAEEPDRSAAEKCERFAAARYGSAKSEPVILFLIDMATRELYLYCTGPVHTVIRDEDALTITDNVYRMASRQEYAACASEAFSEAYALVHGYRIKRPMKWINNILLALLLGFLLQFLLLKGLRFLYRRQFVRAAVRNSGRAELHAEVEQKKLYSYRYRESRGGSGSGHSFGGGHFSAGSGGHSGFGGHSGGSSHSGSSGSSGGGHRF